MRLVIHYVQPSGYAHKDGTRMDGILWYYAGFGAGIFYLLGDIVGGLITPDYNYVKNAVSELIQSGAKNRLLLSSFMF